VQASNLEYLSSPCYASRYRSSSAVAVKAVPFEVAAPIPVLRVVQVAATLSSLGSAVKPLITRVLPRLGNDLWQDFQLAVKEVSRRKRRSGTAVIAIAFGLAALLLSAGFIEWIFWAMREGTIRGGLGHLQITRPGYQEAGMSDPLAYLVPDPSERAGTVEVLRHLRVETLAGRMTFYGLISREEATLSFQAEGVMADREALLSRSVQVLAGRELSNDPGAREVLLGEGLAQNLGAQVGDTVVLLANGQSGGVNAVEATVVGLFGTDSKAYDDVAARLPLGLAHALLRVSGATRWIVTLSDTDDTGPAVEALRETLPAGEFAVTPWWNLADFYNKTVVLFSKQVKVLKLIVLLVVVLTISNTLTISVIERTTEIGTALALGRSQRDILRGFLVEGGVLGLAGAIVGLAIGLSTALAISEIGIPMPPPPGMSRGYVGEIRITSSLLAEGTLLALLSALLGALVPAWRASRMTIVDAIRQGR
jgi:putative ABC transport system permease protein